VRLSMDALSSVTGASSSVRTVVVLDRFDGHHDLHRRNREWLSTRNGYRVVALPGDDELLVELVRSPGLD